MTDPVSPSSTEGDEPKSEDEPDHAIPDEWSAEIEPQNEHPLIIDIEGFEGPLDVLLTLSRTQKLDLAKISILELVDQYIQFVHDARALRLELAADYLVMAAWLAFLKSKLLLPPEKEEEEELSGEQMAAQLAFRLKRLHAMREAVAQIMARPQLGQTLFARGMPEGVRVHRRSEYIAEPYELLKAYAIQRQRTSIDHVHVEKRKTWSIKQARGRLEQTLGMSVDWQSVASFLSDFIEDEEERKTVLASTFSATLEMTREGELEIRQAKAFAPLYIRKRSQNAA